MQNDPNDDALDGIVRKVVEDILKSIPHADGARIIGYTVITGPGGDGRKRPFQFSPEPETSIPYEIIESDDAIYISATLPKRHESAPFADINPNMIRICVDNKIAAIELPCMVDVTHSHYRVHRGVMDITLRKVKPVYTYTSGTGF